MDREIYNIKIYVKLQMILMDPSNLYAQKLSE